MRKFVLLLVITFIGCSLILPGFAAAALEDAKAMVEKAEAFYKANGPEKTLQELNNPKGQFANSEHYVFAYDAKGTVIAHPINPKLIGVNTVEVPDVNGKVWRKEVLEKVGKSGEAVVDYKYKNPKSGNIEQKTSYFKKVGDIILGCGTYK